MPRLKTILATALLLTMGCTGVFAGDFVPRSGSGFAPVGDDAGARAAGSEAAVAAAMSESDATSTQSVPASPSHANAAAAARPVAHIGADDVAVPVHRAATDDESKAGAAPVAVHKSHAARWQSLLPGVMK